MVSGTLATNDIVQPVLLVARTPVDLSNEWYFVAEPD